jgi:hypothetical protein
MDLVRSYAKQVDRVLAAACTLFPGAEVIAQLEDAPAPTVIPPEGRGGLAAGAHSAASSYRTKNARAGAVTADLRGAAGEAAAAARQGAQAAAAIRQTAATDAVAITAATHSPEGVVLLVARMDERLAAMQDQISATRSRLESAAERVASHGQELTGIS